MENKQKFTVNPTDYITLLSVVACIAVIIIHTNGIAVSNWEYFVSETVVESIFIFAVPIFMMISGANLMDYSERYSTKDYFIKRFKKTVIPFLFWNTGLFLENHLQSGNIQNISLKALFQYTIKPPNSYYFFIPLFCIYAVIPFFSAITKEKRKFVFSYIIVVAFAVNIVIPFLQNTVYYFYTADYLLIGVCAGYSIFPIIGYLLKEYTIGKKMRITIYCVSLIGLLMYILGTYMLSFKNKSINGAYKGYTNVPCVLYTCGVFLFFKDVGNKIMQISFLRKLTKCLAKYTFGIYLLHELVFHYLCRYLGENTNLLICRLGLFIVIIPICVLIIFLLQKIPIIKNIVP